MIYLNNFPIPASHNRLYDHITRRTKMGKMYQSRKKSNDYLEFERDAEIYKLRNRHVIATAKELLLPYKDKALKIEICFYIHRHRLYTLKNTPKRFDLHNLMKSGMDVLCKLLEIDDSLFFEEHLKKMPMEITGEEGADISITPLTHS